MDDLDKILTKRLDGLQTLSDTAMKLILECNRLRSENERLKQQLEFSRKLQEKPKLYPPDTDPYYGEEDGA